MTAITLLIESHRRATLLLTRVLVALIFLWHGLPKAIDPGMAHAKFVGFGLPGALGPTIGWIEVAAALLLLVGYLHRWAALALVAIITGALVTVQIPAGATAGLERDLLILTAALLLLAHGPGAVSVDHRMRRVRTANSRTSRGEIAKATVNPT